MVHNTDVTRDQLVSDLKAIVVDAEELLKLTADQAGGRIGELRGRLEQHLASARSGLTAAEAALVDKARQAAHATDDYVRDHPWQSVGVAAGIGFLLGLLSGRR